MRNNFKLLFIFSLIFILYSCASVEWKYEKDAIILYLKSDPKLNYYKNNTHTLVLCAYQLNDPNVFNQLIDRNGGLSKLLECTSFDPSVTSSKRLLIYPDRERIDSLDRAEGTKYVGIVAGYYLLKKNHSVRFFEIPLSFFFSNPKILRIDLYLGPQKIQSYRRK